MNEEVILVYDKECPLCDAYCQMLRIRKTVGHLRLIDARESSDIMEEITGLDLDIDQGMVLKLGGKLYYGADAINMLALISTSSGIFNRFNYWVFRSRGLSLVMYPFFRFIRNLLLKYLGKTKINNLRVKDNEKF